MEETHQKPPRTIVTVADDSSDSRGLDHTYCVHRELKRSGHAARLSVLMAKKRFVRTTHCAEANRPVLFADLSGSRSMPGGPARVDLLLDDSSLSCPLSTARTRHCCSIIRHGEPVLGHDISASRKPGKTCQHTVTWRVFAPLSVFITIGRQPPFSDRAGHPEPSRPKGRREHSRRAPRQLCFLGHACM